MSDPGEKIQEQRKQLRDQLEQHRGTQMYKLNDGQWAFNTRDLMRASSCDHCTRLAIARELHVEGLAELLAEYPAEKNLAMVYGDKFEAEIEAELLASLGEENFKRPTGEDGFAETVDLMKAGTPVIYQGHLRRSTGVSEFRGRPDFLVRADYDLDFVDGVLVASPSPEREGKTGYIAWDAKLASSAKPHYLLQVALYVDALESLGLKADGKHGLILGSRRIELFEEGEIVPAMKQGRSYLEAALAEATKSAAGFELANLSLHCETVKNCDVCEYPGLCDQNRKDVDHLVQVANINKSQIEKLRKSGISTMSDLANASDSQRPTDFVPNSFDKLRKQAKLQSGYRQTGKHDFVIIEDPEIGVLPPASKNDVFFDMEGFPYYEEKGGLEYLFGAVDRDKKFYAWWAHSREQEAEAFTSFVTWAHARMVADPGARIYHYAAYEVTALTKLANRHGVMESEVDWLITEGKLIDLFKVVRGSIMISQPSYSIKKLEAFYDFARKSTVLDAGSSIDEYDRYRKTLAVDAAEAERLLKTIADYNDDDCVSTLELYQWLASMPGAHSKFASHQAVLAAKKADRASENEDGESQFSKAERELAELQRATAHMAKALDEVIEGNDPEYEYRRTVWQALVHSVLYYKREEVIFWRERRLRCEATLDALHEDRNALVVEGCTTNALDLPSFDPKQKVTVEYEYILDEGQTCLLKPESKIFVRFCIGANQNETDWGQVTTVEGNRVSFTRTTTIENAKLSPDAIFKGDLIGAGGKNDAVRDHALQLAAAWVSPLNEAPAGFAALDLLMRRPPNLLGGKPLSPATASEYLPAVIDAIDRLDNSVLAIQGPPGSGKTYIGSHAIAHLVAKGKSVAVVANSHSAVDNLLMGCLDAGVDVSRIAKQATKKNDKPENIWKRPSSYPALANWRAKTGAGHVIGGTSWTFCNSQLLQQKFDYIFVDEAAQFALVDAIAVAPAAKNMVLLGDPQQLTQVVQAIHPGGVDNSALGHYMGEHEILPPEVGYFVEVTRRMHPKINAPVSWLAYQNKLHAHESANHRNISGLAQGLDLIQVNHIGNSTNSPEEVEIVVNKALELVPMVGADEVLVVAPYNAQVDAIRSALDQADLKKVEVGTVDKFQGREAMAVIVSLAASSAEDAPRGLEFLLNKNRLNVAISRAKTNCYLVYSPALVRTNFKNIEDVKCVSRLVGLLDFAKA
ncbi:MAG: hypothetical protein RLZZ258_243 [Actinomycetota bacterium]|jgi:uncharacterized protein